VIAPRDEVATTPLAEHGGRHGLTPNRGSAAPVSAATTHDFSVCLNAFGPSEIVLSAMAAAVADGMLEEYPDPRSRRARAAASLVWHCGEETIVFGAGAAELIQAVCSAYVRPGDHAVVATPAFGEYARAAALCGARIQFASLRADESDGDGGDVDAFIATIAKVQPRLVFIASPANPTGEVIPPETLQRVATACASSDTLFVLDQAYDAFADAPFDGPALPGHPNVVHLRSLTKEHALAGVRAGYAVAPPTVAAAIEAVRVPWAASTIAQVAAVAALSSGAAEHVARTTAILRAERARISLTCAAHGIGVRPSSTHYVLIRVGDAVAARARLLDCHDILVRDCASFGLREWVRVAARRPAENDVLIRALRSDSDLVHLP
jgi:histidinol-phosphate aminotransferase